MNDSTLSDPKPLGDFISVNNPIPFYPPGASGTDGPPKVAPPHLTDGMRYFEQFCPVAYKEFDPEHPNLIKNRDAINAVLSYQFSTKGLLLTGPTNKGKTRVAWQLLKRLYADDGVECRWYHSMDFFSKLQEFVSYGRDDAREWVSAVANRRVVFIDDLGQEANLKSREEWAEGWFFRFLDWRLERKLPLIITTNLTAKDIANKQGDIRSDPLLRRMLDVCDVVKFA